MLRVATAVAFLFVNAALAAPIPTGQLPDPVSPVAYDLTLTVVPERNGFSGTETITIEIHDAVDVIWMHGNDLEVSRADLTLESGDVLALEYEQVNKTGLVRLTLPRTVQPQRAKLDFTWEATYSEELDGIYKVVEGGKPYVFSQFEPISARKVFPSFDEPRFKTPFKISLKVKPEHAAITTTPAIEHKSLESGLEKISYAQTKPLPTYLIAFAVGPLDVVEAQPIPPNEVRSRPLPLRGVAAAGKGEQLQYALKHTGAIVAALERYTGIPYPYQKLDIIAVPDFGAGAMENVGAITFREYLLLLGDKAPLEQKRSFAGVMAHELAHYWFGDLVTVPWWDDIWLNEAFATWLGNKVVDEVWPEYRSQARLFNRILHVMDADSLVSARQIREPIKNSDDIYSAFDGITYVKGAAILGMFERYVGKEAFQHGVHQYLSSHAHGSGDYLAFIKAIEQASDKKIEASFKSFLNQNGLPIIAVEKHCDGDSARLKLSQSRYLPLGSSGVSERTWDVPVCLRYGKNSDTGEQCLMMHEPTMRVPLDTCPAWILPNAGGSGYYRWSLESGYADLMSAGAQRFDLRERMTIVDNIGAAMAAGRLAFDEGLPLLAAFADSSDPLLANAPMDWLEKASQYLATNEQQRGAVQQHAARLYQDALARLALLPSSAPETQSLKEALLDFLFFTARSPALRTAAAAVGQDWIQSGAATPLDRALLASTLGVAVQEHGAPAFKALVAMLEQAPNPRTRSQVIRALGHADDPESMEALHELVFSDRLRSSEIRTLLSAQADMPQTRLENWQWVKAHFDQLKAAMPAGHAGGLPGMASDFCSLERASEVEAFFKPKIKDLQGGALNLTQTLEAIRVCAAIMDYQRPYFHQWLKQNLTKLNDSGD